MKITAPRAIEGNELSSLRSKIQSDKAATFIHIPKTAGTSILDWSSKQVKHSALSAESGRMLWDRRPIPAAWSGIKLINNSSRHVHDKSYMQMDLIRDLKPVTFAVVRNPYDWLVSMSLHDHESDGWRDVNKYMGNPTTFNKFVTAFCNTSTNKFGAGTHRWHPTTETGAHKHINLEDTKHDYWCYREFTYWQAFDPIGDDQPKMNHVDVYIRYEFLMRGFTMLFGETGKKFPWKNRSKKKKNYKKVYGKTSRKLIEKTRSAELELFGYDFDGPTDDHPLIIPTSPWLRI
jgi:hypothetical protein